MPYVPSDTRDRLYCEPMPNPWKPGELNYVITEAAIAYCETVGLGYDDAINAVVGALECCKLEFYRRVAVPYEERKIVTNGDVYPERLAPRG